jgi:hypothetical protein
MQAYAEAISTTSTEAAPWYIVPANHNWYRNLMVADTIVSELKKLKMKYPPAAESLVQYRKQLETEGEPPAK